MKVLAISKEPRKVILESCKDVESPPTFTVRSLTRREYLKIMSESGIKLPKSDNVLNEENPFISIFSSYETTLEIISAGLLGWENLLDNKGKVVPFSLDNLDLLGDEVTNDLAKEVSGAILENESKNSETPS
ncbi:MAG TPA: hypothetical protein VJ184_02175 [Chryseolinea sp.]|nr:hypothetical protein [Chryseolinea sp.]